MHESVTTVLSNVGTSFCFSGMYVYLRWSSILLLSTAEIALEKHADVVRALLYLKPGLPIPLKVSFRIFILRSISGP
jgi:hypothetical protein